MKLMQLNMWGGKLLQPLLRLLAEEKPDILCLQEAIDLKGTNARTFGTIEEVLAATHYAHHYFSPVFGFRIMHHMGQLGNCIMSKYPFVHTATTFTTGEYQPDLDTAESSADIRNFQHATFEHAGKLVNILNYHGCHVPGSKDGSAIITRQTQQVADYVKVLDGPVLLSGDLNLHPHSTSLKVLNDLLENLCLTHSVKTTRTPAAKRAEEVCDYIFVNDAVKVRTFAACDEMVSDHKALILEFAV